ncbi:MAG: cytochrome c [Thermoleophilia bacterium]|nr:cytochrome c [Thermoleophilia bacterium]
MSGAARRLPRRRLAAAAAVIAGIVVVAGCGSAAAPSADVNAGAQVFARSCASCHTLGAAGSSSQVGPNLDDSFRASRQAGMDEAQFRGVVRRWIEIAQPPMPRNLVTGQDAENVAAYVASVAGKSPESTVRPAQPRPPEAPDPPRQEQN